MQYFSQNFLKNQDYSSLAEIIRDFLGIFPEMLLYAPFCSVFFGALKMPYFRVTVVKNTAEAIKNSDGSDPRTSIRYTDATQTATESNTVTAFSIPYARLGSVTVQKSE